MKKGTLILLMAVMVYSCKEKETPPDEELECLKCNLINERIIVLSDDTVNHDYVYENCLLVKSPNHTFTYNDQNQVETMRLYDHVNDSFRISLLYEFENGLLNHYTDYSIFDGTIYSTSEYFYENQSLVGINITGEDGMFEIEVETDESNNPTVFRFLLINGIAPSPKREIHYEYDDKLNPYYLRPGFIESEEYFSKNNRTRLISIVGNARDTIESKYEYLPNGYISKKENQGITTFFTYDCP